MVMFVRSPALFFAPVPVGINDEIRQDDQGEQTKHDHHWPLLPGLAQEFEKVLKHLPHNTPS